jgi:hypothetical protein
MTKTSELYEATGRLYDQGGYYHGSADVPSLVRKINAVTAQRDRLAEALRQCREAAADNGVDAHARLVYIQGMADGALTWLD